MEELRLERSQPHRDAAAGAAGHRHRCGEQHVEHDAAAGGGPRYRDVGAGPWRPGALAPPLTATKPSPARLVRRWSATVKPTTRRLAKSITVADVAPALPRCAGRRCPQPRCGCARGCGAQISRPASADGVLPPHGHGDQARATTDQKIGSSFRSWSRLGCLAYTASSDAAPGSP